MEENLGAFEEKRNEAAETAESAGKGGKHLAKGGKRGWAIAGIALGVLAAAYLGLCAYATLSGTIYPNTTVGGVDYGGMTEEQAAAELADTLHMTPAAVRQRLHRLLDHAGCERVRFHDLRHTFATNALAHGMDIKTLSTILGHVSAATTLNTYSHITEEMRRQAAARIDAGIAKAQPLPAEENTLQERTMTDFQARKRWSRRTA